MEIDQAKQGKVFYCKYDSTLFGALSLIFLNSSCIPKKILIRLVATNDLNFNLSFVEILGGASSKFKIMWWSFCLFFSYYGSFFFRSFVYLESAHRSLRNLFESQKLFEYNFKISPDIFQNRASSHFSVASFLILTGSPPKKRLF